MPRTLTIRNVPERVVRALRQQSQRNGRSMQKELLAIIRTTVLDRASWQNQLDAIRSRLRGHMSVGEIHKAIDEGRP